VTTGYPKIPRGRVYNDGFRFRGRSGVFLFGWCGGVGRWGVMSRDDFLVRR